MWNWIKSLFTQDVVEGEAEKLKREIQGLRLEMEERDQLIGKLKDRLEYQRKGSEMQVSESVQVKIERLLENIATPVTQLMTQAHLIDMDKQSVGAKDVIILVKRMVRVLEDHGMKVEGKVGDIVPFDPDQHEPLSAEVSPKLGEQVVVRIMGVSFKGRLLRKVGIEKVGT